MRFFEALASLFINTFGITQPTPDARRRAAWFIVAMLTLLAIAVTAGSLTLYRLMHG